MKKILLLALLFATALTSQAQVVHDADAEVRKVSGSFSGVDVSSAIDLYISQGNEQGVAISANDPKIKERIKTEVKNGVLHIWFDSKGWDKWNMNNKKMKAYVTVTEINKLEASGACDVRVNGTLKAKSLKLSFSGASDFEGSVQVTDLQADASGASDIKITGSAVNARIDVSGASDFKGKSFKVDYCKASASGAADIDITVNKELEADASGGSDISYSGDGVIKKMDRSGGASIKKKG